MSIIQKKLIQLNRQILQNATNDLIRKKLVPDYTISYIQQNLEKEALNRMRDKVKTISCQRCGISLPSRFLMRQHMKQCYKTLDKQKENETIVGNFPVYWS